MPVKRPAKLIKTRRTCCFIPKQMVVRLVMFDSNHWFCWASLPASGSISVATCYKSQETLYGGLHTWTSSHHHSVWCCRQTYVCTHHLPSIFLIIYPAVSSSFTQLLPNIQPTLIHMFPSFYPPFTHHLTPRIHILPPFSPRRLVQHETTMFELLEHLRPGGSGDSAAGRVQKCSVVEMINLHLFACHI